MERVTYIERGIMMLNNLNFQIYRGEIMGLVPVDSMGLEALLQCLRCNRKLLYGRVYIKEKLVNTYSMDMKSQNNIMIINGAENLVEGLSAADNAFLIRRGHKPLYVKEHKLRNQLKSLLSELDIDVPVDKPVKMMSVFERYVITLVKAAVDKADLIVLKDMGAFLRREERKELTRIVKHYAASGISFIYVSTRQEELFEVCDRVSMMLKGSIIKVLEKEKYNHPALEQYMISSQSVKREEKNDTGKKGEYIFEFSKIYYKSLKGLSFQVRRGECTILYHDGNLKDEDMINILCDRKPDSGEIMIRGKRYGREDKTKVSLILENPTESMLFYGISYADNLCLALDRKIRGIWMQEKKKRSILRELCGSDTENTRNVKELPPRQKYKLLYTRVLMQKPEVVFCFYPYRNIDVNLRTYIESLIRNLLNAGIAVVIIAVNFRDVVSLADQIVLVNEGINKIVIEKNEFKNIIAD